MKQVRQRKDNDISKYGNDELKHSSNMKITKRQCYVIPKWAYTKESHKNGQRVF